MAVRVLTLGKDNISKVLVDGLLRPVENAKPYFQALAAKIFQQTGVTFQRLGARAGNPKWTDFGSGAGVEYYRLAGGGYAKRPGTGPRTSTLRYEPSSKLLQATGGFRNSFTIIKVNKRGNTVGVKEDKVQGITLKIAKAIMSNPERPVLFVNKSDYKLYGSMFRQFLDAGIKF